jgi:hypothetical protein
MRRRSALLVGSLAIALCLSAHAARAATLSLASADPFWLNGVGPYSGPPLSDPVTAGSMELDAGGMSFWFSIFSDADPFVLATNEGDVPVVLRIDEIRYESPAPGTSVSGTMRGALTVGATTTPFLIASSSGWQTDGYPAGELARLIEPGRVTLGYTDPVTGEGAFIVSGLGVFPATDVVTLEGVTYGLPAIYPEFWTLVYVPEPGALSLLGLAGAALLLARQRSLT